MTAVADALQADLEGISQPRAVVVGIMAGEYHACAWDQGGGVSCWGENEYGEYGSGNSPGSTHSAPCANL